MLLPNAHKKHTRPPRPPNAQFGTFKTQKVTFKLLYSQQHTILIYFWQVFFLLFFCSRYFSSMSFEAVLSRSSHTHRLLRFRPDSAVSCGTRPCWSRPCCWEPALPPAMEKPVRGNRWTSGHCRDHYPCIIPELRGGAPPSKPSAHACVKRSRNARVWPDQWK